jgi:phosphoribosyl 1,2-cyclic phosphate phosphodiesterase
VAAVVEGDAGERILIDTPPELRLQLLAAGIASVDAVLYTHDHADHIHGIDDLRAFTSRGGPLPIYGPAETLQHLGQRFSYIFDQETQRQPETPRPELTRRPLAAWVETTIAGLRVLPLEFQHGLTRVFGYRIGALAYVTDVKAVPDDVLQRLRGVRVLVLNALFDRPHPTHLSIPEAVAVAQAVGAERTLLTHLTHRYGHAELAARLPAGVEPACDGLSVSF